MVWFSVARSGFVVEHCFDLTPQPGQDSAPRGVNRANRNLQLSRGFVDRLSQNAGPPKGGPSRGLNVLANTGSRLVKCGPANFKSKGVVRRFRLGFETAEHIGVSGAAVALPPPPHRVDCLVPHNGVEPSSKPPTAGIGLPAPDCAGNGRENFLGQVLGVGVLHPESSSHPIDHRFIEPPKLGPGPPVRRITDPQQERIASLKGWIHEVAPLDDSHRPAESDTVKGRETGFNRLIIAERQEKGEIAQEIDRAGGLSRGGSAREEPEFAMFPRDQAVSFFYFGNFVTAA
jgi:hypothetical protein